MKKKTHLEVHLLYYYVICETKIKTSLLKSIYFYGKHEI